MSTVSEFVLPTMIYGLYEAVSDTIAIAVLDDVAGNVGSETETLGYFFYLVLHHHPGTALFTVDLATTDSV